MALYPYVATLAVDPVTLVKAAGATGVIYAPEDTQFASPLTATDPTGNPIPLVANVDGILPSFYATSPKVNWRSGSYVFPLVTSEPLPGPKGEDGGRGADGTNGKDGKDGAPGVNAVPTAQAVATYAATPGNPVNLAILAGVEAAAKDPQGALKKTFAPTRVLVESHALGSDASDDLAWSRAIAWARALGWPVEIVGSKPLYEFAAAVDYGGLKEVDIRGRDGGRAEVRAKAGAGVIVSAFTIGNGSADTSDVTFENFFFNGGMTNGATLGTKPARATGTDPATTRVFAVDRIAAAIKARGANVPGSADTYPTVGDITVRGVKLYGIESLPVLLTGLKGRALVTECHIERCLDTGFTYNESAAFINNDVYYSADNGVSLSRGNKRVTCSDNRISDSWFYGVFISGFDQNAGPVGFVCGDNEITRSYEAGIGLFIGPSNGTVTGNTIDTVYRGTALHDAGSRSIGVGIRVGGYVPVAGDTVGPLWAKNIKISVNTIIDAARGGILITSRSANVEASDNLIIRPGSELDGLGVVVPVDADNQNFGILLSGGDTADDWGEIRVKMNTIIDDRAVPLTNRGVFVTASADTKTVRQFNIWSGTRVPNDEKVNVGPGATVGDTSRADTRMEMLGANNGLISLIMRTAAGPVFRITKTSDSLLEFGTYPTIGSSTIVNALQIHRALGQARFPVAPRLPSYTTATRPSAVTLTAGAVIIDSTLNKQLHSDGTVWRDAMGTAV